jgi:site-specific DNA-adenine methylase
VIAVGTLAVQLGDSVKKLVDFWHSIQEAPEDIQNMADELKLVASILRRIASDSQEQHQDNHREDRKDQSSPPSNSLRPALELCQKNIAILNSILTELEPGFASCRRRKRKWTAFKTVLKRDRIEKIRTTLESLKSTLILAYSRDFRCCSSRSLCLRR